ncbi:MAG TPA: M56 family metallopeptidase [Thermoanaerobaculia bacterium]|jgi:beta-lactamase regulating signal transducer with metallopeptidase domain
MSLSGIVETLARASFQGALFVAAVWIVCRLFPRLPAALRCGLWWAACLKLLLGLFVLPAVRLPLLPAASPAPVAETRPLYMRPLYIRNADAAIADTGRTLIPGSSPVLSPPPSSGEGKETSFREMGEVTLAGLWIAGLLILVGKAAGQLRRTRRIVASAEPVREGWVRSAFAEICARLGLRRAPDLRGSADVRTPQVTGLAQPVVLIPRSGLERLTPAEISMTLCHELVHLRRKDLWLGWVPALAHRIFFFHPLAALAVREYAIAREAACDAEVLRILGTAPQAYGRLLLRWGVAPRETGLAAAGASPSLQNLKRRLQMLQQTSDSKRHFSGWWWVAGAALLAGLVPLQIVAQPRAPKAPEAAQAPQAPQPPDTPQADDAEPTPTPEAAEAPEAPVAQDGIPGGVEGGVPGGVEGGVAGGVEGGIPGGVKGGVSDEGIPPVTPITPITPRAPLPPRTPRASVPAVPAVAPRAAVPSVPAVPAVTPAPGTPRPALAPVAAVAPTPVARVAWASPPVPPVPPVPSVPPGPPSPSKHHGYSYRYSDDGEDYVLIYGGDRDSVTMSGSTDELARVRRLQGSSRESLFWFRHGGKEYVIRDAAFLKQAEALFKVQAELGARQGELGGRQGALGARQGALGAKQGALGAELGTLSADRARRGDGDDRDLEKREKEIDAKMEALSKQQEELGRQQEALGHQQEELGRQQEAASRKAQKEMRTMIDRALQNGQAQEVR